MCKILFILYYTCIDKVINTYVVVNKRKIIGKDTHLIINISYFGRDD